MNPTEPLAELYRLEYMDAVADAQAAYLRGEKLQALALAIMLHGFIASAVLNLGEKDAEKEADRRGWLRLSDYGNRTAAKRLNQRQRNTLFDYCQHHGCDYHEVLESIKFI